jgi:4-carboxymuconolactone decarboxylase
MTNSDRYDRGLEKIRKIYGEAGENVIENLKDISPDFTRYIIEFPLATSTVEVVWI